MAWLEICTNDHRSGSAGLAGDGFQQPHGGPPAVERPARGSSKGSDRDGRDPGAPGDPDRFRHFGGGSGRVGLRGRALGAAGRPTGGAGIPAWYYPTGDFIAAADAPARQQLADLGVAVLRPAGQEIPLT